MIPAYCRDTHASKVRVEEMVAVVAKAMMTQTGTHWNLRCSEELQQSLQRSQCGRLHINSFLLQFDGVQSLFEFPHQFILKTSTTHSTGSFTQPVCTVPIHFIVLCVLPSEQGSHPPCWLPAGGAPPESSPDLYPES